MLYSKKSYISISCVPAILRRREAMALFDDLIKNASEFVKKQKGVWDHIEWEKFVKDIQQKGVDLTEDTKAYLGGILDAVKKLYSSLPLAAKEEKKEPEIKAPEEVKASKMPKTAKKLRKTGRPSRKKAVKKETKKPAKSTKKTEGKAPEPLESKVSIKEEEPPAKKEEPSVEKSPAKGTKTSKAVSK